MISFIVSVAAGIIPPSRFENVDINAKAKKINHLTFLDKVKVGVLISKSLFFFFSSGINSFPGSDASLLSDIKL